MARIRTIGYQGAGLDALIATLGAAGVTLLLDVRGAPVSRKPGFSRKDLAAAVEAAGIAYVHLAGLGNPKAGKRGDHAEYERIFRAQLASDDGRAALAHAMALAAERPACLMCFEAHPAHCHRTLVAGAMADAGGFTVEHLTVRPEPDLFGRGDSEGNIHQKQ